MNFNNFTIKSQEVVQKAVELSQRAGHQAIYPEHLLKAIIGEGEAVVEFIFQKLGVSRRMVEMELERAIAALPKVSGAATDPYLSREANDVMLRAADVASKLGDEYVTVEALLMAIFETDNRAATILKNSGVTKQELEAAVSELRKGRKATDQSAEESYQALSKYAINLNERSRQGKLDP